MKISRAQSSTAFYLFIIILILFVIGVIFLAYVFGRNVSLASLQAKYPNVGITTILYIITGVIFVAIFFIFDILFIFEGFN